MSDVFKLVSILNPTVVLTGGPAISAGTNSQNTGTIVFGSSAGNVTFGMDTNGYVTATAPSGGGAAGVQIAAGTQTGSSGTIKFENSNGITFGISDSTRITASHNGLTTAAQSNHSHGVTLNLTNISGTTGGNSVGVTLDLSAAAQTNQTVGMYATGNTTQSSSGTQDARSLSFRGEGIASVGITNGSVVVSVPSGGGAGDGYNILAAGGATAGTAATVQFDNANGVSFGLAGSTITASHNGLTTAALSNHSHNFATTTTNGASIVVGTANSVGATIGVPAYLTTARASTDALGLNTAGTNVTWTANSSGISINAGGYAGTGTSATNASVTLNSNGLAISVAAPGGGGGAATLSGFEPYINAVGVVAYVGNGTLMIRPQHIPYVVSHSIFALPVYYSQATNSTLTVTLSAYLGIYTNNASTWSQVTAYSGTMTVNGSGTASSNNYVGVRLATFGATGTVSGDVGIAVMTRTSTEGANASMSNVVMSQMASNYSGVLGVASTNSNQSVPGAGLYLTTQTTMPISLAWSGIDAGTSARNRHPIFYLTDSI